MTTDAPPSPSPARTAPSPLGPSRHRLPKDVLSFDAAPLGSPGRTFTARRFRRVLCLLIDTKPLRLTAWLRGEGRAVLSKMVLRKWSPEGRIKTINVKDLPDFVVQTI